MTTVSTHSFPADLAIVTTRPVGPPAGPAGGRSFPSLPSADPLPALVRGEGPPLVLVPGFALTPRTYARTVDRLAERARVVVPDWVAVAGRWEPYRVMAAILATLDEHGIERASWLGHSFGGGLSLGIAARHPERIHHLVLADSVGLSQRWELARKAIPGRYIYRLATVSATTAFLHNAARRPTAVARAGWWAFRVLHDEEIREVADHPFPAHVLWAERDTLLERDEGRRFAERLGASFTLVREPEGAGTVDHDWLYRRPWLVPPALERIGVLEPPLDVAS